MIKPVLFASAGCGSHQQVMGGEAAIVPVQLAAWDPPHPETNHILGVPKTTAEMWEQNLDWGAHNPAKVIEDVGYVQTGTGTDGLVSTAELWAALDVMNNGGAVYLLHYILSAPAVSYASNIANIIELPGYSEEHYYVANLSTDPTWPSYRRLAHPGAVENFPVPTGEHRVAIRVTNDVMEMSVDGGAVQTMATNPVDMVAPTHFALYLDTGTTSGPGASSNFHHVHFFDPATVPDDAALMALSA